MTTIPPQYVLGSDDVEVARLDSQAAFIAEPTALLVRRAGVSEGMRVLELGTGLGHVAFDVARLVGPSGEVVAIDQAEELLVVAEHRRAEADLDHLRFKVADARTYRDGEPFDAIVTRLMLFHLPDAVEVVRHHLAALKPGGLFVAVDFDIGTSRAEPRTPLAAKAFGWIEAAFRSAGADPRIGAHLALLLAEGGVDGVQTMGIQAYLAPDDPVGPALLAGVVSALAPQLLKAGLATEDELGLETLRERIADEAKATGAVMLPPSVVGAWGRRAS
jgi:SAM-dependent methyltransferase